MNIHLLYFARLGEQLGQTRETITVDKSTITVKQLKKYLVSRNPHWEPHLENNNVLCAANQIMANNDTIIENENEVAFFPPVTGG